MTHLDAAQYRALLTDPSRLTPELRAHLGTGCPTCAEGLAGSASVDPLDGPADAALLRSTPAAAASEREFEAIYARVGAKKRGSFRIPFGIAAGLAVAVIASAVVLRPSPVEKPGWDGQKGAASLSITSSFAVVRPGGKVERGVRGAAYPPDAALAVRVELPRPLRVSLVRVGPGASEVLLLNAALPAGVHDLQKDGAPLGISLKDQLGTQHVAVLGSERELSEKEASAAANGEAVEGVARAGFDVVVAR